MRHPRRPSAALRCHDDIGPPSWSPWDFGPWHPERPPITEDESRDMAARLQAEWSPSFHERVEVALKKFVDHTIRASLLPRDPFRAGIRMSFERPDQLSAILGGNQTNGSDDFARSLVRDYLDTTHRRRKENDPHLAWAVDAVRWMEAEIKTIASSPSKRGRTSKLHLDNLMSAVTRIARGCDARGFPHMTFGEHPTGYPLYTFAR